MTRRSRSRPTAPTWGVSRRAAALLLPAALAILLALPAFSFTYLFDDYDFLARAQTFRWSHLLPDAGTLFYRPVSREIYFAVLYLLDPNHAFWGHLGNTILLALSVVLVGTLTGRLCGRRAGTLAAAAFASLGALPVLVGWVSGAQDLLAIVFLLAALHFALARRTAWMVAAAALALLSKETAIAFLPALALLPWILERKLERSRAGIVSLGALAVGWAAVHPGIRQLLANRLESGESHSAYLTLTGATAWSSMARTLVSIVNCPVSGASTPWPSELNAVLMGGLALVVAAVAGVGRGSRGEGSRGAGALPATARIVLLCLLLTIPEVVVSSLLVRQWELYYAGMAAIGSSMLLGIGLARLPRPLAAAGLLAFLTLGVWCRGMDLGSSIPTERNMRAPSERLRRARSEFLRLHPTLEGPTRVYASVDVGENQEAYLHLFRFQIPRIWYRNHSIDTMHPEWRRPDPISEHLLWVSSDLTVHEIDTRTLGITSSGGTPDSTRYNTTLRSYSLGLGASGSTDRAVQILLGLKEPNPYAAAFDRRLAAALLLADGRNDQAEALVRGLPAFSTQDAVDAACGVLANPSRRDIDVAVMSAMGLSADDPEAVRQMMRWFALNRSVSSTIRFANRLLAIKPDDPEAATVLKWLRTGIEQKRATVPSAPDSLW